ncbi:MAG: M48 family metalloprotease [Clostridia bacterium]|nr:M48 family metalloprotease [Clostridia bacterium]
MDAKALIVLVTLVELAFGLIKQKLADRQRRLPLPPEVADVYDADRYRRYLEYVAEHKKLGLAESAVSLLILLGLLYAGIYPGIERSCGGNPYLILLATFGLFRAAEILPEIAFSWYDTFRIEEKYGFNKMDGKEFARHTALSILSEAVLSLSLLLLFAFVGEHLPRWTDGFSLAPGRVVLLVAGIAALTAAAVLLLSLFSLFILKRQYHFTPFPEGELKDKIMALQEGSRKKVRILNVYDESRKSTAKNAFLLKFLWHREFGIADNFLTQNADRELLAILSHEIGHLKHRKNALDFLRYAAIGLAIALFALLLRHPSPVLPAPYGMDAGELRDREKQLCPADGSSRRGADAGGLCRGADRQLPLPPRGIRGGQGSREKRLRGRADRDLQADQQRRDGQRESAPGDRVSGLRPPRHGEPDPRHTQCCGAGSPAAGRRLKRKTRAALTRRALSVMILHRVTNMKSMTKRRLIWQQESTCWRETGAGMSSAPRRWGSADRSSSPRKLGRFIRSSRATCC